MRPYDSDTFDPYLYRRLSRVYRVVLRHDSSGLPECVIQCKTGAEIILASWSAPAARTLEAVFARTLTRAVRAYAEAPDFVARCRRGEADKRERTLELDRDGGGRLTFPAADFDLVAPILRPCRIHQPYGSR